MIDKKNFKILCDDFKAIHYNLPTLLKNKCDQLINRCAIYVAEIILEYLKEEKLLNREVEKAIKEMIQRWKQEPESLSDIFYLN